MPVRVSVELRSKLPALWLLLLLIPAILLPDRIWNSLLVGVGGLFVVAYIWARTLAGGLRAARRLKFGWVGVGDRLEEQFELVNEGWLPAFWIEIQDDSNVPGYRAALVRSVNAGSTRWRQNAICQQRGQFRLGPWRLVSGDPFGFFRVTHHLPVSDEIIIHPPIHSHVPVPLPAGQSDGRARARQRAWQATINAAGARRYQPHDPYRWIHWPTLAHTGELYVREFDLDAAGDIWIYVDMEASSQLEMADNPQSRDGAMQRLYLNSTAEHAIIIAAALAAQALRQNRGVGVACYGQTPQVIPPGRGQGQQWRILRALALAQADGVAPLATGLHDLGQQVGRNTAVVIITPNGATEWLAAAAELARRGGRSARGGRGTVVLLDRPSFGGTGNSQALRDLIRQLFAECYVLRRGDVALPALTAPKHGFWEFKVTPSGKAIPVRTPYD